MKGVVIRVVTEKGFGFIRGENGTEYFFHKSALRDVNLHGLKVKQEVTFDIGEGEKGPRAEDVYLA